MFKFITQGHKLMKIRSGIIALATLAVLVGVITTLALSSFTAEAQGTRGAIANLQLTSTTAGTLTVSWDAASPTPTDYRVDWAKSGENYKSWKVDDGHKYLTVTSIELTDLDEGVEYKVRARARFYKGDAASPTPTDYRVDWAKSGENYKSWKVDDGHKYLTVTSIELTDLDEGVEYKVRARGRAQEGSLEWPMGRRVSARFIDTSPGSDS